MKIAAVVIVYYPDKADFIQNLNTYVDEVDTVLVWLNSREDWLVKSEFSHRLLFLGDGTNEYMGKPLNKAILWCVKNGYDYLLTMDQDSRWVNCKEYISYVKEFHRDDVAIYAPDINNQSKVWITDNDKEEYSFNSVITSGCLCNVKIASQLEGFREDFKIYWIDEEYCEWARMKGYKIIVLPKYQLSQQFGKMSKTRFGFCTLNYSPLVYYFLVRNSIWMRRNGYDNPSVQFFIYKLFFYLRGILLSERQKRDKLKMIAKGIWDGAFNKIENRNHEKTSKDIL